MGIKKHRLAIVVIAITVFAISWWALGGYFANDDWYHLDPKAQELWAKTFTGDWFWGERGKGGYYRPLIRVSIALDRLLYNKSAWGFHLTNLMVHFLCCLLVYFLAFRLLGRRDQALIASLFFGLFPLNHQSVFWISGRTDTIAALFILLAVYLYLLYVIKARYLLLATSLFSFILALLSKEASVISPLLIVGLSLLCWKKLKQTEPQLTKQKALLSSIWYFVILLAFLIFRQKIMGKMGTHLSYVMTWHHFRETYYSFLTFLIFPFYESFAVFNLLRFGTYFFCVIALIIIAQHRGIAGYLFLWVIITIVPMLSLGVSPWDGSRFLYLPLAGWAIFCSAIGLVIVTVFSSPVIEQDKEPRQTIDSRSLAVYYLIMGVILCGFAAMTIKKNIYWYKAGSNCRNLVSQAIDVTIDKETQYWPRPLPRIVILPMAKPLPEQFLNPWDTMNQSLRIMGNLDWQLSMGFSSEATSNSLALMIYPRFPGLEGSPSGHVGLRLDWKPIERVEKRVWESSSLLKWRLGKGLKYDNLKFKRQKAKLGNNNFTGIHFTVEQEGDRGLYSPPLNIDSAWHLLVLHFKPITIKRGLIQWRGKKERFSNKRTIILLNEVYYIADRQEINLGYSDNLLEIRIEPISHPGRFVLHKIELYSFFLPPTDHSFGDDTP